MKKTVITLATIILTACGNHKLTDLKLNVDKPADVEAKFGKPDTIVRNVFMGMSAEFWAYRKDSFCLLFRNDILTEVEDHCFNGFKPTQTEMDKMNEDARRMADSIAETITEELNEAMGDTVK